MTVFRRGTLLNQIPAPTLGEPRFNPVPGHCQPTLHEQIIADDQIVLTGTRTHLVASPSPFSAPPFVPAMDQSCTEMGWGRIKCPNDRN